MPDLLATQLVDLVATTIRNLGRPNYEPLMTDIQEFTAFHNLLDETRVAEPTGGYGVQWNVAVNNTGTARNTGFGGQLKREVQPESGGATRHENCAPRGDLKGLQMLREVNK